MGLSLPVTSWAGQGGETHHRTAHGALATLPQLGASVGLAGCGLRTATLQHTCGNKPCASVPLGRAPGTPPITLLLAGAGQSDSSGFMVASLSSSMGGDRGKGAPGPRLHSSGGVWEGANSA